MSSADEARQRRLILQAGAAIVVVLVGVWAFQTFAGGGTDCKTNTPLQAGQLVAATPAGMMRADLTPEMADSLIQGAGGPAPAGGAFDSRSAVALYRTPEQAVTVVAFDSSETEIDAGEWLGSLRSSAPSSRDLQIAGSDGVMASLGGGNIAAAVVGDCGAVMVFGTVDTEVEAVAKSLQKPA